MADNHLSFPHSKLAWYQLARQFVRLVHDNPIQDATLRKHASDSVRSTAIHTAEGAARWSKADKSRVYVMARAECCEAISSRASCTELFVAGAHRAVRSGSGLGFGRGFGFGFGRGFGCGVAGAACGTVPRMSVA